MTKLEEIIERAVMNAKGGNPLAACRRACRRAVREALLYAAQEIVDDDAIAETILTLAATLEDKT